MKLAPVAVRLALGFVAVLGSSFARAQTTNEAPQAIDLPTVLRLAGAQNLDVQIASARLKEAQANRSSALEQFFPWLAPGVSYHRRDGLAQAVPSGVISEANFQSYSPGATLVAQVDIGNAIYESLAAKQLVSATDQALGAQRQDSALSAAQAYFDLAKAGMLLGVAQEARNTSRDYEEELHVAVTTGIAFKGDELRVRTQTERYEMAMERALGEQRVAAANLARILHLDPKVELVAAGAELLPLTLFETNAPLDRLVGQALNMRPELKQSQALLAAAHAKKNGAVYGPLIPVVGAQAFGGGLGGGADHGASDFGATADVVVGLSWRIGPGGLFDSGRISATKARMTATELSGEKLKDDITAQVVTAFARVRSLAKQMSLALRNLATANETLRLTRERKQYGVGIVLEDIQAQQNVTQARGDYFIAVAEYNKAQYDLNKAVGGVADGTVAGQR